MKEEEELKAALKRIETKRKEREKKAYDLQRLINATERTSVSPDRFAFFNINSKNVIVVLVHLLAETLRTAVVRGESLSHVPIKPPHNLPYP